MNTMFMQCDALAFYGDVQEWRRARAGRLVGVMVLRLSPSRIAPLLLLLLLLLLLIRRKAQGDGGGGGV